MITLRKLVKKSYAALVLGGMFIILSNYCGLQAFETGSHGGEHHEHHATEVSSHDADHHNNALEHAHESHHSQAGLLPHKNDSAESNRGEAFCCPSNFCCSTINVDAALRDQLYYFFLEASNHTTLTPVAAFTLSDPFKVQEIEWLHDIGPPQVVIHEPFHIQAYPSHAPPLS